MRMSSKPVFRVVLLFLSFALLVALFFSWKQLSFRFFESDNITTPTNRLRDLRDDSNLPPPAPTPKKNEPPVRVIPKNDKGLLHNVQVSQADMVLEELANNDSMWMDWLHQLDIENQTARLQPTFSICNLQQSPNFLDCDNQNADSLQQCLRAELQTITQKWLAAPTSKTDNLISKIDKVFMEIHVNNRGAVTDVVVLNFPEPGDLRQAPELVPHFPKMRPAVFKEQPVSSVLFLEVSFEAADIRE